MPDTTPGHMCYAAFCAAQDPWWAPRWAQLMPQVQQHWEAAAQAVLAPRLTEQAAQLHYLIDSVVEHAPPAYLDKVHIWLTDLSGIVHQEHQAALLAGQALRPEETPMPDDPACADRPSPAFASIEAYGDDPFSRVRVWCSGALPAVGQRFALVCTGVVQTDSSVQVQFQLAPLEER